MSSSKETPLLTIYYGAPAFTVPDISTINSKHENKIFSSSDGIHIARTSPIIFVNFGPRVCVTEVKTMIYVSQHTSIPVPKIYAYATYGPLERKPYSCEPPFDTYIFMEFVDGRGLDGIWVGHTKQEKMDICSQLRKYVDELQSISTGEEAYIGSVDRDPVMDDILNWQDNPGPFGSEEEFHSAVIDAFEELAREGNVRKFLSGIVSQQKHSIVFTHGDLSPENILMKDGKVVAIVDWEVSGWYPEYWEVVNAFYYFEWMDD